jgi:hypothetical protein
MSDTGQTALHAFFRIRGRKMEGRAMQRRRIKHTTTFEERLARETQRLKEAAEKSRPVAQPASCFCVARDKPRQLRS